MREEDFQERQQLEKLVKKIDRDVDSIIVEGFMDRKALERLGFNGKIFQSAERTVEDLVEDVSRASEKVAVLTDFDSHGKNMNRQISHELEKEVDVMRSLRDEFGTQLTSTGRRAVEEIRPLFESKEQKFVEAALDTIFFRN